MPSKILDIDAVARLRKAREFLGPFFEERAKSLPVPALVVMERGRHLNQSMKKILLRTVLGEPEGFERFMGFEEALRVEEFDSFLEGGMHEQGIVTRISGEAKAPRACNKPAARESTQGENGASRLAEGTRWGYSKITPNESCSKTG